MIYIRADSNSTISGGHIMRCLAVANALTEQGETVCFLVADDNPISVLEESQIPFINLHSDWQDLMSDMEQVKEFLKKEQSPVLFIDTYQITREYVDKLKPYCKIAYLGSKQEYLGTLDLLVNYSTDIDYEFYSSNYDERTTLLLGPSYAPLRKEFQNIIPKYKDRIERILITTGNVDRDHMVTSIIKSLKPVVLESSVILDVVIGRMFNDKEELHQEYDNNPNVFLYENVKSMSSLMRNCDLAISANGTTVYELSAMGLPTISFAMVEEQVRSAEALSKLGVIDYCGKSYVQKNGCIDRISKRVRFYLSNNGERIVLAEKAHQLIDGNGVSTIASAICSLNK